MNIMRSVRVWLMKNKFFNKLLTDKNLRTFIGAGFSFILNIAYAVYNGVIGFSHGVVWNECIAFYYIVLIALRCTIVINEAKWKKRGVKKEDKAGKRCNLFIATGILLIIMDIALIAPIALMAMFKKEVNFSTITAIAFAAYTVYKIVRTSISFAKSRKNTNLSIKGLMTVNFAGMLMSILTLQNVLILTFGAGDIGSLSTLVASTSFAVLAGLVFISVYSLCQAVRLKKKLKKEREVERENKEDT